MRIKERIKYIINNIRKNILISKNIKIIFYDLNDLVENSSYKEIYRIIRVFDGDNIKEIKEEIKKIKKIWD